MKKKLLIVFLVIFIFSLLVGCSSEPKIVEEAEEKEVTPQPTRNQTEKVVADQTYEAIRMTTINARTPDTRSDFEKCVENTRFVRYVITGDGVSGVSLTWANDTGGTEQGDYKLPFCLPFDGFKSGDFLYLSAQIIQPTSGAGTITCTIYDGNTVVSTAKASGFPKIATCSGSK